MDPNTTPQAPVTTDGDSPESNYDDFSSVFDSLTDKGTNDDASTESDSQDSTAGAAGDAGQQVQPPDGAGDSGQPAPQGGDAPTADGQGPQDDQGGDAAGGQPGDQGVDWESRFRDLEARVNQPPPAAPAAPEPAATAPDIYTAEERAELTELQSDWPDLHKLFSLMARQVQVDTLNYAFSEVGKVLAPLQETVQSVSINEHTAELYEAHEDYDQVYQPCLSWVEKQPGFLKAAYQNVVKQGTADEVALMIQRFKDETGWAAPAAGAGHKPTTAAAAASAPTQTTGLSEAAKKAARAMGAVGTKRGAQAGAQDPGDFDGAWAEANAA